MYLSATADDDQLVISTTKQQKKEDTFNKVTIKMSHLFMNSKSSIYVYYLPF